MKLNSRNGWLGWWPEIGWRSILDPENARILTFLREQRARLKKDSRVLDAAAGAKPFKHIFESLAYESCDMPGGFYQSTHDFECYLDDVPRENETYDVVVLTQVLEHVPDPLAVLREINRILMPGGKLLVSVPLTAPLHGEPWHFFLFSHYGIAQLAKESGFAVSEIEKIGGAFWVIGKRLPDAFIKLFKQYDPFRAKKRSQNAVFCVLMNLLLLPVYILGYLPSNYMLRPLFYWLDRLDHNKEFTLGYTAVLEKL